MLSTLADFQTKDLNNLLKVLRAKYDLYKKVNPGVQDEDVLNQFLIVKKILSDRKAFEPSNSILDTDAGKFQDIADKFGEPYAEVKSSDDGLDNGNPEITLEQIETGLKSFLAVSPIAWLVGGIIEQKSVKNDVDFLISLPEKQELERIIKFRISRSFPFDIRDRLHFLCEQKGHVGAFTDNLPLYRFLIERIPDQEIVKMAEVRLRTKESGKYKAQAEEAIEKDEVTPGEFYLPVKPVRGYLPGKEQTLGLFLDLYDTHYHYPALSSKKFDGMHLEIHKDGDKVTIFSEDGSLLEKLHELKKEIKNLLPSKCVIEGELELWNYKIGQHLPRETVNPEVDDDSFYTTNVFECLLFEGKIPKELKEECEIWDKDPEEWKSVYFEKYTDTFGPASEEVSLQVHRYPSLIRFKFLEFLGIKQKTVKVPDAGLNLVEHFRSDDRKDLEKKTEELRAFPGSEGNVVSDASVRYHLTSGKRPYQMLKFHNSFTFNAIAVRVNETKTGGIYTVDWAVPSGMKTPDKEKKNDPQYLENPFSGDFVDIWMDPSPSEIYEGGRTFSTALKVKAGKTIKIECETLNIVRSHNDVGISAWSPRLLGAVEERPHTLSDLIESAMSHKDQNCIQFKMLMNKDWFVIDPEKNPNVYLNGKPCDSGVFYLSNSDLEIISWNNAGTFLSLQRFESQTVDASEVMSFAELTAYGGPGSGHFGHSGRSGLVGGSLPGTGGGKVDSNNENEPLEKHKKPLNNPLLNREVVEKINKEVDKRVNSAEKWLQPLLDREESFKDSRKIRTVTKLLRFLGIVLGSAGAPVPIEAKWAVRGLALSPLLAGTKYAPDTITPEMTPEEVEFEFDKMYYRKFGPEYLESKYGPEWLDTTEGKEYSANVHNGNELEGYPPRENILKDLSETDQQFEWDKYYYKNLGEDFLVQKYGRDWLDTPEGQEYYVQVREDKDYLKTSLPDFRKMSDDMGPAQLEFEWDKYCYNQFGPEYLEEKYSKHWLNTFEGKQYRQSLIKGKKSMRQPHPMETKDDGLVESQFETDKYLYEKLGEDYLTERYGRKFVNSEEGQRYTEALRNNEIPQEPLSIHNLKNAWKYVTDEKLKYEKMNPEISDYLVGSKSENDELQDWVDRLINAAPHQENEKSMKDIWKQEQEIDEFKAWLRDHNYKMTSELNEDLKNGTFWKNLNTGLKYIWDLGDHEAKYENPNKLITYWGTKENPKSLKSYYGKSPAWSAKDYKFKKSSGVTKKFAEDESNPAIEEIKTKLKKLILSLLDLSKDYDTAKANSAKKIMEEIERIRNEILAVLIDNKLSGVQLDDYILSPRKIPVIFEIKDEEALIKDLKSRKLNQFLFLREDVAIDALKEYILQHEKDTDFKMPAGLEKSENRMALYMFRKGGADKKDDESGEVDHSELLRFYESPYDPSKDSNEQLADAWRLMCAHYATWKRTDGKGIVFSREEIIRNAVAAVKEIKERVAADKMKHTFDIGKMEPASLELYDTVNRELPDGLLSMGENNSNIGQTEKEKNGD